MGAGASGRIPARAPLPGLHSRLIALRGRAEASMYGTAWASALPGFCCAFGALWMFAPFTTFALMPVPGSGAMGASFLGPLFLMILVPALLAAVIALLAVSLVRIACRNLFARNYAATWRELFTTNLMPMVVDEDYTRLLTERIDGIWSLRWISPPPPRKLEQQLEFAACYQAALRRMLFGVGRLENGPVWQGSFTWYAGQARALICGCAMLVFLSWPGIALWVIAGLYHVQRCAALAAYCDFLLYEHSAEASPS